MCTNKRWIYNRFIQDSVLCNCGHCKSCLQDKANMYANRIREHSANYGYYNSWFITLTYDNDSVPFFYLSDLMNNKEQFQLPIRRNKYFDNKTKSWVLGETILDAPLVSYDSETSAGVFFHEIKKLRGCIGVGYYKDVQDFKKRLNTNLKRNYYVDTKLTFFSCLEYGPNTQRPHFHLLCWTSSQVPYETFVSAVVQSWPFGDSERTAKYVEHPRDCSMYLSSYVNSNSYVAPFLLVNFRPKVTASIYLGIDSPQYSAASLLDYSDKCAFTYTAERGDVTKSVSVHLVSKRALCRFFPQFKGYSRFSPYEVFECITQPKNYDDRAKQLGLTTEDFLNFRKTIIRGASRLGLVNNLDVYALLHNRVWSSYYASRMKFNNMLNEQEEVPLSQRYDNIAFYLGSDGRCRNIEIDFLNSESPIFVDKEGFCLTDGTPLNPNLFAKNISASRQKAYYYDLRTKDKKVKEHMNTALYKEHY